MLGFLIGCVVVLWGIYIFRVIYKFLIYYIRIAKTVKNFPGPNAIQLLKKVWEFYTDSNGGMDIIAKMSEEYPLFCMWLGPKLIIVSRRPCDIEVTLTSSRNTQKGFPYQFMRPLLIDSLITGDGATVRAHRRLLEPLVNGKSLSHYIAVFNKHIRHQMGTVAKHADMKEFDIYDETECCMADIVYETIFGAPANIQQTGDLALVRGAESFLDIFYKRSVTLWLFPSFIFNLTKSSKIIKDFTTMTREFCNNLINKKKELYMALARGDPDVKKPNPSVLDLAVENIVKTNAMDNEEMRSDLITLFLGSQPTILGTFSFALLMLAMHQELQKKVREEVLSVIGHDADVTEENLKKLTYIDMVFKETIRLYPIGPILSREISEDIETNDYTFPEGATLFIMPMVTHRSDEHWDEPQKFIPERFLPENSKNRHPYAYIPFSGGARSCVGKKYATMCFKTLIVYYIRNYEFITTMKLESLELKRHISVTSTDGYKLSMRKLDRS